LKLTEHFSLSEFTSTSTALPNIPSDIEIVRILRTAKALEEVRQVLGHPIHISSGFRSEMVNRAVGGADNSAHMLGLAADIKCPEFGPPKQVCMAIIDAGIKFDQLINEYSRRKDGTISNWVHFGLGVGNRQQVLTRKLDGKYYPGVHGCEA